jgi:hypothetical protein
MIAVDVDPRAVGVDVLERRPQRLGSAMSVSAGAIAAS